MPKDTDITKNVESYQPYVQCKNCKVILIVEAKKTHSQSWKCLKSILLFTFLFGFGFVFGVF